MGIDTASRRLLDLSAAKSIIRRLTMALRIEHLSLASDLGEGYHYGQCRICDLLKEVEQ